MPLPSFLQRKKTAPNRKSSAPAAADSSAVDAARTRARRRLIGAVVLLAAGIIGFPLVFETQPRPIALDIPIQPPPAVSAAAQARAEPVPAPAAATPASSTAATPAPVLAQAPGTPHKPKSADLITERAAEAGRDVPAPVVKLKRPVFETPSAPLAKPTPQPAVKAAAAAAATPPTSDGGARGKDDGARAKDDGARAKALLSGQTDAAASGHRYVVQVGAFSKGAAAREVRQKVEKLGLRTYTQVAETAAGKSTRVRVGPFTSRDEAERAGAKLKSAGLPAQILTL